jgi:peptidoglycan/LPS O-acetylase OafA/YrhL
MRAIAALGVVCWHYRGYFGAHPFEAILAPFYKNGMPMVDFFFVLSGFVFARAYWMDSRRLSIASNLMQRIARLYPLHLVMLLIILGIQLVTPSGFSIPLDPFRFNDAYNFGANLLLLQSSGLQHGLFSFNWPSWSISTEFIVNIAFLFVIALPRRISIVLVAILAAACVAAFAHRSFYDIGYAYGYLSILVARTGAGFFIGALTYRLYDRYQELLGQCGTWVWNILFAIIAISMYGYFHHRQLTGIGFDLAVSLAGFPALIVAVSMSPWALKLLTHRPLVWLGERSYSIYMIHYAMILCLQIMQIALGIKFPFASGAFFLSFVACAVAISAITYRYIELPGKRFLAFKSKTTSNDVESAIKVSG